MGSKSSFWKNLNPFSKAVMLSIITISIFSPELAYAGLSSAQSGAQSFLTQVLPIIRVLCIIGVVFCGLAYANGWVDNQKLFKIGIGIVIISSATEFVNLLWA